VAPLKPFPGIFPDPDEEEEQFIEGAGSGAINKPRPSATRNPLDPERYKGEY